MADFSSIFFLLLVSSIKLGANVLDCERKEKYFAILALAEESVSTARQLHPDCVEENNFSNPSNCCESDRISANLDIALNLMKKLSKNYPDCGAENYVSIEEYFTTNTSDNDKKIKDLLGIIMPRPEDNLTKCEPVNTQSKRFHKKPMDCSEILENGNNQSGLHRVWLRNRILRGKSIKVFCDMDTDGGGWTIIQRRGQFGNSEDYFERPWEKYKHGFGDLTEEFWLGNDKIFALTNQGQYSVRFDMTDVKGTSVFAEYKIFWVGNEENKYKLHISKYRGNAGDSLSTESGAHFYTFDNFNQPKESKSEWKRSGGWWLDHVMATSLNGLNLGRNKVQSKDGITWSTFGGFRNSLVFTEIKVRPKKFRKENVGFPV